MARSLEFEDDLDDDLDEDDDPSARAGGARRERAAARIRRLLDRDAWRDAVCGERAGWRGAVNDIFVRPVVARGAAVVLAGFCALIGWLTYEFWRNPPGGEEAGGGVIEVEWGLLTVAVVAAAALYAGFEPLLRPAALRARDAVFGRTSGGVGRAAGAVGGAVGLVRYIYVAPAAALSWFFSAIDWFFAKCLAVLAGASHRRWTARYGLISFWVVAGGALGWTAPSEPMVGGLSVGLWAILLSVLMVFAIARRWSWVEGDREIFMVSRNETRELTRIGFQEDLRDEALFAVTCLFVLAPIGLRAIHLSYDIFELEAEADDTLLTWIGFFGAELLKAVPLVDWSEVFHVANGSPIEPKPGLGSVVVFALRVSLDLLLLASVLLAVQISGRLRDRSNAFQAGQLPILDPFSERRAFRELARRIDRAGPDPLLSHARHPSVAAFPSYDVDRLKTIVRGPGALTDSAARAGGAAPASDAPVLRDLDARRAALTILAKQDRAGALDLIGDRSMLSLSGTEGALMRRICAQAARQANAPVAARALMRLLEAEEPEIRRAAAHELGRIDRRSKLSVDALRKVFVNDGSLETRAQAALSLTRMGAIGPDALRLLAPLTPPDEPTIAIMLGVAMAQQTSTERETPALRIADEAARHFAPQLADRLDDAFALAEFDAKGLRRAPHDGPSGHVTVGSPDDETGRRESEGPQFVASVDAFEIAATAVTRVDYRRFALATARGSGGDWEFPGFLQEDDHPVVKVPWRDAVAYCSWLSQVTGERYRLPSEVEWEFACRAGAPTPFFWGDGVTPGQANYRTDRAFEDGPTEEWRRTTTPAESFTANPWGLFNMHGNVWEWCLDCWRSDYADAAPDAAPYVDPEELNAAVVRGGSWSSDPANLRAAGRSHYPREAALDHVGFRVVRVIAEG